MAKLGQQTKRYDVAVIGAGIVGSSLAMALGQRGLTPVVLDIDLSGRLSSSEKNAGGIRATWWQPVNITLCKVSIDYYESIAADVGFRQKGYLWLYDEETWPRAREHAPLQRSLGQPVEELTPRQIRKKVPELDKLDGVAGATFSPRDGLINPNLLKEHYRERSRESGAKYLDGIYVHDLNLGSDSITIDCWQAEHRLSDEGLVRLMTQDGPGKAEKGRLMQIQAGTIAICGGAWSNNVLKLLGLENLTEPVRRQISIVDNRETNLERYGMIVDTSGLYFHNEGPHVLAGYSPPEEPPGYTFRYDGDEFFQNEIWPRMFNRMSRCERLRHVTGWAGLYAVTPDRSAIVGKPLDGVYEAHSFSGRGVMQSYGAGQALAELIAIGKFDRFEASALSRERFKTGALVTEPLHI